MRRSGRAARLRQRGGSAAGDAGGGGARGGRGGGAHAGERLADAGAGGGAGAYTAAAAHGASGSVRVCVCVCGGALPEALTRPGAACSSHAQVLVKNEYAGINFIDTYHRGGLYPRDLPFICGQEGGGTVVATTAAAEAAGIAVGDRVAYSVLGTYCEYTAVPAAKILAVPVRLPAPRTAYA